ncbi:MAG: hypothetical protein J7623_19740 [Chitinophaga sp.]|uniref:hypothetical protein n=1 Tax=Chitinophaga sp. TaxID=1869181 RepID=UPI001B260169|nr:hypothetical protein [Chitinophaga sp.]MBO9730882.1 hypothetical protein [Chitinophaga sp.]
MIKKLSLFVLVVAFSVSCKKDKSKVEDESFVGCWQSTIQLQHGNKWPAIPLDSIRAAGNFSYELKSNHTGIFKRVVVPANKPISADWLSRWKPGMPIGSVYTPQLPLPAVSFPTETVAIYWEYNKKAKQLLIMGSIRQKLEAWELATIGDHHLITTTLEFNLAPTPNGLPIKQHARVVFIKK